MLLKDTVQFSVDEKGPITGQQYTGMFTARIKLSSRDRLREDEICRTFLGANSQDASVESKILAGAIAYLSIRITDAPDWWKKSNGGADLLDDVILVKVHNECMSAIAAEYKKLTDEAEKAQVDLKKVTVLET